MSINGRAVLEAAVEVQTALNQHADARVQLSIAEIELDTASRNLRAADKRAQEAQRKLHIAIMGEQE